MFRLFRTWVSDRVRLYSRNWISTVWSASCVLLGQTRERYVCLVLLSHANELETQMKLLFLYSRLGSPPRLRSLSHHLVIIRIDCNISLIHDLFSPRRLLGLILIYPPYRSLYPCTFYKREIKFKYDTRLSSQKLRWNSKFNFISRIQCIYITLLK